jgi:hypothetical protein
LSEAASDLFHQLLPNADLEDFRGAGYATLGAANFLIRFPGATEVKRYLRKHAERVASQSSGPGWIERWPSHDWPVAAQSMIVAASTLKDDKMRQHARSLIDEMREATSEGRVFLRRGENPDEEELPTSAAAFIEALGAEFHLSRDNELLKPIRAATDWFLGANRVGMPLYDFSTGGCHDALTASGLNRNQGTQATVFCLLAFLTLHRIASIVDSAAAREASPS